MVLCKVAEPRTEAADRGYCSVAYLTPFVGCEPCFHGVPDDGGHRAPGPIRPLPKSPRFVVGELNLHTLHVHTVASRSRVMVRALVRARRAPSTCAGKSDRILGDMKGTRPSTGRIPVILFGVLALGTWATLLYLGRGVTFFQDEWRFVDVAGPFGTLEDVFGPQNEHWSTLPFLLYRSIFNVVGLSTYLPYLAVLLALHVTAAAALFVLLFRRNGPLVAIGGALLALWVGTGYQNLFWAFQIGFVGSTAAGLWALVAFAS